LERLRAGPLTKAAVVTLEVRERLRGRYEPLTPPPRLLTGGPHYREIGEEFKAHMIGLGGLRRSDRVLDIGCGEGRMAVPLLDYLEGDYEGFDFVPIGIVWCRRHITRRNPKFRFQSPTCAAGCTTPTARRMPPAKCFPIRTRASILR
jgi:hypothetical protein